MPTSDSRGTVLGAINEVRKLLGYGTVSALTSDRYAEIGLRLLNNVITDISDNGDWEEQRGTVSVTAVTSTISYSIGVSSVVKRIYEISFDNDSRALDRVTLENLNQFNRRGGVGRPRFFAVKGVDSQGNPKFSVSRQPGTTENGKLFSVEYFTAPRLYDTAVTAAEEIPFPFNMVVQGLYAQSLLEQNGGTSTKEYLAAEALYQKMRGEAQNRYTSDTGSDATYLTPPMWGRK